MTGKLFDITFENVFSFRDCVTFSMQGVDSDLKSGSYDIIGDDIILKTAVIYGANGSGKTNIIKFLNYFLNKLRESLDANKDGGSFEFYEPYLLDRAKYRRDATSNIIWRFFLQIGDELRLYKYDVTFNQQCFLKETLSYTVNEDFKHLFTKTTDPKTGESKTDYKNDKTSYSSGSITPTRLLLNLFLSNHDDDVTPAAEFLAGIEFANGYNRNMFERMWNDTKFWLQGSPERILKLEGFLKHVDVQFQSLVIPEGLNARLEDLEFKHAVYNGNEMAGSVSFNYFKESVGTSSIFLLGAKVIQALEKGCPLFVDEMDSNFHGFITKFIVKMFQDKRINNNGAQLILTTHNISLMDEKLLRKDQVWFTNKNKKGVSDLYSLAEFEDVREDSKFIDWYMASKFGGVPQIDFSMLRLFDNGKKN